MERNILSSLDPTRREARNRLRFLPDCLKNLTSSNSSEIHLAFLLPLSANARLLSEERYKNIVIAHKPSGDRKLLHTYSFSLSLVKTCKCLYMLFLSVSNVQLKIIVKIRCIYQNKYIYNKIHRWIIYYHDYDKERNKKQRSSDFYILLQTITS